VVGAQPSGRLMGLRLRPALLLPARRFAVLRPFIAMLRLMGEDYQAMRDGFPDLMTEKGEAVSFVEVKGGRGCHPP
jgi:hypothetical protein